MHFMTKTNPARLPGSAGAPPSLFADPCQRVGPSSPAKAFEAQIKPAAERIADPLYALEIDAPVATSVVAAGAVFETDIIFSGSLRIDGEVRGNVCSTWGQSGVLVIGENGSVNGNIQVTRLVIYGTVTGGVYARDSVTLHPKSHVTGDVRSDAVELLSGAVIQGRLRMQKPGSDPARVRDAAANDRVQFPSPSVSG